MKRLPVRLLAALAWLLVPRWAVADQPIDFEKSIRPIFVEHCFQCHGPEIQESNYRLDQRAAALAPADMGPAAIQPGDPDSSPLIRFVSGDDGALVMPPDGPSLTKEQVHLLTNWIRQGASWPDHLAGSGQPTQLTTDHWSFQPLQPVSVPDPPTFTSPDAPPIHPRNEIDAFVFSRLKASGLEPSQPAGRAMWLRRLCLDMLGLLPTPQQVEAFLRDPSAAAYDRAIDQVLTSPHYGERWARHWLDVVRFGESTGYEVNRDRPNAWHYRDYVIDAFNRDLSYREFVRQQLAGDVLSADAATGFLVGGPHDMVKSPDPALTLMQRQDELADYVNTTATAFLGLTVGCARCHNHKFDPILQKDYYAMQAVFAGVEHGERQMLSKARPAVIDQIDSLTREIQQLEIKLESYRSLAAKSARQDAVRAPVNPVRNVDQFPAVTARRLRFLIHRTNGGEPCLDELQVFTSASADSPNENIALASRGTIATSSGDLPNYPMHKLQHINDGQFGNANSWIADRAKHCWVQLQFPAPRSIQRVVWGRDRQKQYRDRLAIDYEVLIDSGGGRWQTVASSDDRKPIDEGDQRDDDSFLNDLPAEQRVKAKSIYERFKQLTAQRNQLQETIPVGYVGKFKRPDKTFRLYRGDPMAPREEVAPDVLSVVGSLKLDNETPDARRRLALANWIANKNNPLTARVIVNRIWHYHFGQGIVSTPSDFGKNGASPTHPDLLDWLAQRFIENGWSLKWLHREILASHTYRQSSRPRAEALKRDAQTRLLWRFPPRRLEAEAIRDCILQVSGQLNFRAGGPGFLLLEIDHENVHHYFPVHSYGADRFRRMVYMMKIRQEQDAVFGVFDCPDGGQVMPKRNRSTTPLQALNLLNSRFMVQQADYLADRLRRSVGQQADQQVRRAFQLLFCRAPRPSELADAVQLIERHGLRAFCRAVLNANEFLFCS